jgi:hypothetical protein
VDFELNICFKVFYGIHLQIRSVGVSTQTLSETRDGL